MPKESNLELKVGVFVVAALVALGVFIFSVSDFSMLAKGKNVRAVFNFANGLKKSAPVRFAGVDSGIVQDIGVFYDESEGQMKVEADLWLSAGTRIPEDSTVIINQLGLMGEKYVEILPGEKTDNVIEDGSTLIGEDPVALEELSKMFSNLAGKLEQSIDGFNEVVLSEENRRSLASTLESLSLITTDIRTVTTDLKNGEGTMGRFFYDPSLYRNLQEMTADLKENPWKLLYRPKR